MKLKSNHEKVAINDINKGNSYRCTFVADITNSRSGDSSRWADLTSLLEDTRSNLNLIFLNSMEKEVVFSGGDSIQGVFKKPIYAFMYGRLLQKIFYPERVKIGIGIGEVFSYFENKNSNYSTGNAFIRAQQALNRAKSNDIDMQINSNGQDVEIVNIMLEMITSIRSGQTEYQRELDLMTEILFPLIALRMALPSFNLIDIVKRKNELLTFKIDSSNITNETKIDTFIKNLEDDLSNYIKPIHISQTQSSSLMQFIEHANVYGIQSDIALLTHSTKQNISKMFNKARIEQLRKYDLTIIKLLEDNFSDHYIL